MSEESRLGREAIETSYIFKKFTDAGCRVFFYFDDRERTLDTAMDKVMLSLANFSAEMEREKGRQRTRDALARKAASGYVVGKLGYGYRHVPVGPAGQHSHVLAEIEPTEAAIVQRIFTMTVDGYGITKIAKTLNAEGIPAPRRGGTWAPTCIREMLNRSTYRGVITWGRSENHHRKGTKAQRLRPASEWFTREAPELRIISDAVWAACQTQRAATASIYARQGQGRLLGRPNRADLDARYLMSGLGYCAICGGPFVSLSRRPPGGGRLKYGCSHHSKRGATVCPNGLRINQAGLDDAVLAAVGTVLDPPTMTAAFLRAVDLLLDRQAAALQARARLDTEIAVIDKTIGRLIGAISAGADSPPLAAEVKVQSERKLALQAEAAAPLPTAPSPAEVDRLTDALVERSQDLAAVLARAKAIMARQVLRRLVPERIALTPYTEPDGTKGYTFRWVLALGGLLTGSTTGLGPGVM